MVDENINKKENVKIKTLTNIKLRLKTFFLSRENEKKELDENNVRQTILHTSKKKDKDNKLEKNSLFYRLSGKIRVMSEFIENSFLILKKNLKDTFGNFKEIKFLKRIKKDNE